MVTMNPRRRRLLIPGLLIILLVVAAIASLSDRAHAAGADDPMSRMSDPRITESSGLAVSRAHPDLAYTINDSGHELVVYAVRLSTGETVGARRITGVQPVDPEALGLRDGTLWIADTGDNAKQRGQAALISTPEPGPGDGAAAGTAHPIALERPADIETLLIDPDGTMYLVTKATSEGVVYRFDTPTAGRQVRVERMDLAAPAGVTDGAFSPDGSKIALLSYLGGTVLDATDWRPLRSFTLPPLEQYETLAFLDDWSVLIGQEGANSPLRRIAASPPTASLLAVVPGVGTCALALRGADGTTLLRGGS